MMSSHLFFLNLLSLFYSSIAHASTSDLLFYDDFDDINTDKWLKSGNVTAIHESNYCPSSQHCLNLAQDAYISISFLSDNYSNISLIFGLSTLENPSTNYNHSKKDTNHCAVYYEMQNGQQQLLQNYSFDSVNPFNNKLPFESHTLPPSTSWSKIIFKNVHNDNYSHLSCFIDQVSIISNDNLKSESSLSFVIDTEYIMMIGIATLVLCIFFFCAQWCIFTKYSKMKTKMNQIESKTHNNTVSSISIIDNDHNNMTNIETNLNTSSALAQSPTMQTPTPNVALAAKSYSDSNKTLSEEVDENFQFIDKGHDKEEEEIHINTKTTGRATFVLNNIVEEVLDDDDDNNVEDNDKNKKNDTENQSAPPINMSNNRMRSVSATNTLPLSAYDLFDEDETKKNDLPKIQDTDSYASSIIPMPNFGDDMSYSQRTKNEPHSLSFADPGGAGLIVLKNRYPANGNAQKETNGNGVEISCTDGTNVRFKDEPTISYFEHSLIGNDNEYNKLKVRYGHENNNHNNENDDDENDGQHDVELEHSLEIESMVTAKGNVLSSDDNEHHHDVEENSLELGSMANNDFLYSANTSDYDESVNTADNNAYAYPPSTGSTQRMTSYNLGMPSPRSAQVASMRSITELSMAFSASNQL